jgi:hypothetical protein
MRSFIICTPRQTFLERENREAGHVPRIGEKCVQGFDRKTSNSALEVLGVNGRIVLKGVFKTQHDRGWTEFTGSKYGQLAS